MTLRRGRRGALSGGGEGVGRLPSRASRRCRGELLSPPLGLELGFWVREAAEAEEPGAEWDPRPGRPLAARAASAARRVGLRGRGGAGSRSERLPEAGAEGPAEPGGPSPAAHLELARRVFLKDGGILSSDSPPAAFLKSPGFHVNLCQLSQAMCGICFYNSSLVTSQTLS